MQICVLLMVVLVPLAIAPGLVAAFDITPKIAILLFCESVMLLLCKQLVNPVPALLILCLGAQGISLAVSTVWSVNPALSIAGSGWRRYGSIAEAAVLLFCFLVTAWFAEDRGRIRTTLRAAVAAGAAASLYGIAQYFGWDPFLPSKGYQAGEGPFLIVRPPGTLGHADYFGNWLVLVAFFGLALAEREAGFAKVAARGAAGLAAMAIVLSGTRSALLGLAAGAVVFCAISRPRIGRKELAIVGAAIVCLAVLYISPAGARLRARVHWSLEDVRGGGRLLLWRDSLHMAIERPLTGYGPETFTAQFPAFESAELARAYPDFYQESPHNMFLDALTSRGVVGMLSLFALCGAALWFARNDAALAAALAGAMVCQQFVVLTVPTALYFYLAIAMAAAAWAGESRKTPLPLFPVVAANGLVFMVFSSRLILADRAMAVAGHRIAAGDAAGAAEAYRTVQRWESRTGDRDLDYSRAMTRLASATSDFPLSITAAREALDAGVRATQTAEDRQNAWYNLASLAALRNDREGVETALRRALDCAPNWFKPHWTLAQLLELTGRHAEARQEASIAMQLNGGHDPEVTETGRRILSLP